MANVKFKACWRCAQTKSNPLEKNWISPAQEVCSPCELEMAKAFLKSLGYTMEDVYKKYKGHTEP